MTQNESAVRELGDKNLRDLAKYITEQLRKSTTVDWQGQNMDSHRLHYTAHRKYSLEITELVGSFADIIHGKEQEVVHVQVQRTV